MNKISVGAALIFFLAAADGASAARKPRNYRWKEKDAKAERVKRSSAAAEAAALAAAEKEEALAATRLMAGKWTPEVREAIDKFIAEKGKGAKGYDPAKPPVAVLPWSDALVSGDPAELVFLKMTANADFKFSDSWWEIIPVERGRQPARAAYEQFVTLSTSVWRQQPDYMRYRKRMLESYLGLCRGVGRKECRSYLARLFAGWREDEATDYARAALAEEKARLGGREEIPEEEGDKAPLKARRGLRLLPHMRDLAAKLRAAGIDVWVIDDVPQPVLVASTGDYGIDPSRVSGVKNAPDGSRMSAAVLKPVPTRGGKTEALQAAVGRPADLVLGRDSADAELMAFGLGLRIALSGDPALEKRARESGWLVQPSMVGVSP